MMEDEYREFELKITEEEFRTIKENPVFCLVTNLNERWNVGDIIHLKEWDFEQDEKWQTSNNVKTFQITLIQTKDLPTGKCILGLSRVYAYYCGKERLHRTADQCLECCSSISHSIPDCSQCYFTAWTLKLEQIDNWRFNEKETNSTVQLKF